METVGPLSSLLHDASPWSPSEPYVHILEDFLQGMVFLVPIPSIWCNKARRKSPFQPHPQIFKRGIFSQVWCPPFKDSWLGLLPAWIKAFGCNTRKWCWLIQAKEMLLESSVDIIEMRTLKDKNEGEWGVRSRVQWDAAGTHWNWDGPRLLSNYYMVCVFVAMLKPRQGQPNVGSQSQTCVQSNPGSRSLPFTIPKSAKGSEDGQPRNKQPIQHTNVRMEETLA